MLEQLPVHDARVLRTERMLIVIKITVDRVDYGGSVHVDEWKHAEETFDDSDAAAEYVEALLCIDPAYIQKLTWEVVSC